MLPNDAPVGRGRLGIAFKPGQSGNPAGRPKKLLKRVDEVLHEKGIEPIAVVLTLLGQLEKLKPAIGPSPKHLKSTAEKRSWQAARRAERVEARIKQSLEIWLEVLPYVYARPKDLPEEPGDDVSKLPSQELAKRLLEAVPSLEKMAKTA